ncbi:MAG: lipocalin-like domain-containing protein, partial [Pseudomonadota bacterium]
GASSAPRAAPGAAPDLIRGLLARRPRDFGPARAALRRLALALLLLLPLQAAAQGFAGMGASRTDEGWREVVPGRVFEFPRDHAPHPGHRIEWWYVTANLEGPDGARYGAQWTLFRQSLSPSPQEDGWSAPQLWMAHAALTSADAHRASERFGRAGVGQAGVTLFPFRAWIDDWRLESASPDADAPFAPLRMAASGEGFAFDLTLSPDGPLVLQGEGGFSKKSEGGTASYYYSHPFLTVSGEIALDDGPIAVTGRAWLDREWSTQALEGDDAGWDWFALHLPDGAKAMIAQVRGEGRPFRAATWISPEGEPRPLPSDAVTLTPLETVEVEGRALPVRWRLEVPSEGLDVIARPLNLQAWMPTIFAYWEGPIAFEGSHAGVGYLEMTGY